MKLLTLSVYPNPFVNEVNIAGINLNEVNGKTVTFMTLPEKYFF